MIFGSDYTCGRRGRKDLQFAIVMQLRTRPASCLFQITKNMLYDIKGFPGKCSSKAQRLKRKFNRNAAKSTADLLAFLCDCVLCDVLASFIHL